MTDKVHQIWQSKGEEDAKAIIKDVIQENFYPADVPDSAWVDCDKHIIKVAEWFHGVLKKRSPWGNWTNDIYDAMRCIDHLPIT